MYRDLITGAAAMSATRWAELEATAEQVASLSMLPVLGAGASRACGAPLAADLARALRAKVADGTLQLRDPPADFASDQIANDLGKVADALRLENTDTQILEALAFEDATTWPSGEEVFADLDANPHSCVYRVLARLAKESLLTEAISFNYDCNFEGGLLKEGFFPSTRRQPGRWPERFSVIANADQNADVSRRAEFTLNKVHGSVQTWRDAVDRDKASKAIVLRWSQLLDWREDRWSRDLFRDRARRHVLFLFGFSGVDPVVHSTLQAVMGELSNEECLEGPSRVRVVDVEPKTLTLRMLAESGKGTMDDVRYFSVANLAATTLVLYALVVRNRIAEYAQVHALPSEWPAARADLLRRIAVTAPAMLRWTWSVLGSVQSSRGLRGLRERRDDYYVPLSASPARTLQAFSVRDEVANKYGVEREANTAEDTGSFLPVPRVGIAFMPLGLYPHEVDQLTAPNALTDLPVSLRSPVGSLDRVLVARDQSDQLRGFSLETGSEVRL
jgi:hypothetical protein